jgi:hypothetical protein
MRSTRRVTTQQDFSDGGLALIDEFAALLEGVPEAELDRHLSNVGVLIRKFLKHASPDVSETHRNEHAMALIELLKRRCLRKSIDDASAEANPPHSLSPRSV